MSKIAGFSCAVFSFFASVAYGQNVPTAAKSVPVASVVLPGGHRVDFFAPPGGPIAIAEVGSRGAPRALVGWWNERSPGSGDAAVSRRTGNASIIRRGHFCFWRRYG